MKLLLTVVALAAVAHAGPVSTQTMEIGANGVQSGSVLNIPLVEIIVNLIKNAAESVVPETVEEPVYTPEPVIVVDEAAVLPEVPAPVVLPEPTPAEVVPAPIVLPEPTPAEVVPAPIVLPEPTPAEVVPSPIVVPEPVEVAPAPIVVPEPVEVVPAPIVLPEPTPAEVVPAPIVLPEPTPAEVVPSPIVVPEPVEVVPSPIVVPEPVEVVPSPIVVPEPVDVVPSPIVVPEPVVIPEPTPAEVVEIAPETAAGAGESGASQIINVMMNFIFGEGGSLASVEVPAHVLPQIVGAPRV